MANPGLEHPSGWSWSMSHQQNDKDQRFQYLYGNDTPDSHLQPLLVPYLLNVNGPG
jgi:hypothetical protein